MVSLGIDIGTTSICVVLYDGDKKEIRKEVHGENHFLKEGSFLQDPSEIVETVRKLIAKLLFKGNKKEDEKWELAGVGISSQMHGILYVNREGRAVSPFYTWKNEYGNESFENKVTYAQYLSEKTGGKMYSGYGSVTHFYLQKNGLLPEDAVSFAGIGDYVAMQLAGNREAASDAGMAASFGGFLLKEGRFDLERLKAAGVDISYYPRVAKERIAGNLKTVENGLAEEVRKVPVYHAAGDNQASFLGAVREPEKSISINVGTGAQVSVFSEKLFPAESQEIRPFFGTGYLYVGASLNGGKVYERLAVFFQEICRFFTGEDVGVYEKMEQLGRQKKETGLRAVPQLYGKRGEEKSQSGFFGLTEDNFHAPDLIRSFVKGMAEELYDLYKGFPEEIIRGKETIAASGNGIRKNRLLQEELEKAFGMPVIFTERREEAAAGAAISALSRQKKEV